VVIAAAAALERGDLAAALAALLDEWRASRDPAIADLIDRASELAAIPADTITRGIRRYRADKWRRMARRRDPRELPALLAAMTGSGSWPTLAGWPDDPRFAAKLVELVPYWGPVDVARIADLLIRLRDRRGIPALREGRSRWDQVATAIEHAPWTPCDPELVAGMAAALAACRRARDDHDRFVRDCLERVFANPDDNDERAVVGDMLLERGDPRGELIALQLAPPNRERVVRANALLATHRDRWLGPLRDAVSRVRFRRGFLDACRVDGRAIEGRNWVREWATVRAIWLYNDLPDQRFAEALPYAPSLRSLRGYVGERALRVLAAGTCPRLYRLALDDTYDLRTFGALPGLPRLRHLELRNVRVAGPIIGSALWQRQDIVTTYSWDTTDFAEWVRLFQHPVSARIRTLRFCTLFDSEHWRFRLTRPHTLAIGEGWVVPIVDTLRTLPDASVDVQIRGMVERTRELTRELERVQR
jgi:uncharacterized protein (TIGR02996 family)